MRWALNFAMPANDVLLFLSFWSFSCFVYSYLRYFWLGFCYRCCCHWQRFCCCGVSFWLRIFGNLEFVIFWSNWRISQPTNRSIPIHTEYAVAQRTQSDVAIKETDGTTIRHRHNRSLQQTVTTRNSLKKVKEVVRTFNEQCVCAKVRERERAKVWCERDITPPKISCEIEL